jgi:hypothetical protein
MLIHNHTSFPFNISGMGIFISYSNWAIDREIPDWLVKFTPSVGFNGQVRFVNRNPHINPNPSNFAPQQDVEKVMQMKTYDCFTQRIGSGTSLVNGIEFETEVETRKNPTSMELFGAKIINHNPIDITEVKLR